MRSHSIALAVAILSTAIAGCGPAEPAFDEQAWYLDRHVDPDPTAWVVGSWVYPHWAGREMLIVYGDGAYEWERSRPGEEPERDAGTWQGDRTGITLTSEADLTGGLGGPPAELRRVPTAQGERLLPLGILSRWQARGFQPGDAPGTGRSFARVAE
ncbi:MAG: hypothetical protein KAS72_04115 [Phycisphaerales bacterium]|nr:hypothetical protein [Phycisphaerales bacterium]